MLWIDRGGMLPGDADAAGDLDASRRMRTQRAMEALLMARYPGDTDVWLSIACHALVDPRVRAAARCYAALTSLGGKTSDDLAAMLSADEADVRVLEVIAWRLGLEAGGAFEPVLERTARAATTPSRVRLTAIESLVALGRSDEATDAMIVACGGTPVSAARKLDFRSRQHGAADVLFQEEYALLAGYALQVGCGILAPILVDVEQSVGAPVLMNCLTTMALGTATAPSPS